MFMPFLFPDGLSESIGFETVQGMRSPVQEHLLPIFVEAKATTATLSKNYRQGQLMGMVDALSNLVKEQNGKVGYLNIVTSWETVIPDDLKQYAADRNIAIYESVMGQD